MNNIEELKKYKALLDNEIITQEEFDKKKQELLADNAVMPSNEAMAEQSKSTTQEKHSSKKRSKKLMCIACIVAVLVGGAFGVKMIVEHNQQSMRATALEEKIKPIMNKYGLRSYEVKYINHGYDIYAEGFESLTASTALACLKELDAVSIDDPCGDGKIDFGIMTYVHPGLNIEYSYWRVSSMTVAITKNSSIGQAGFGYKTAGLYCNQYGNECVYACEN